MARVLVSLRPSTYHMKDLDLVYPLVPSTLKSGQGLSNGGLLKSSSFYENSTVLVQKKQSVLMYLVVKLSKISCFFHAFHPRLVNFL